MEINAAWLDEKGGKINHQIAIVPLMTRDIVSNEIVFIGTAFYVTANGLLLTAKHCVLQNGESPFNNLFVLHIFEDKTPPMFRQIHGAVISGEYDIAYLMPLEIIKNGQLYQTKHFALSDSKPQFNDQLCTYGYPKSQVIYNELERNKIDLNAQFYLGKCGEYHPKGFGLLKNPCYQTTIKIMGGASGGPVLNKDGKVFAICSTGYDLEEGQEDISFITPIAPSLNMEITDGIGKTYLIRDLIKTN